jgi:hypothetical protein
MWRRERDSKGVAFAPKANKGNELMGLPQIRGNRENRSNPHKSSEQEQNRNSGFGPGLGALDQAARVLPA